MVHIADIDFPEFYALAFGGEAEAQEFFEELEGVPNDKRRQIAKRVLHQAARMLWLSDRMDEIANGRPALRILFFLIAAEAVAKLTFEFKGEGQSKKFVRLFFDELCSEEHRGRLGRTFSTGLSCLNAQVAIDYLYDVRCDVVHEGIYFAASLLHSPTSTPVLNLWKGSSIVAHLTAEELRSIVLEGAVLAAHRVLTHT